MDSPEGRSPRANKAFYIHVYITLVIPRYQTTLATIATSGEAWLGHGLSVAVGGIAIPSVVQQVRPIYIFVSATQQGQVTADATFLETFPQRYSVPAVSLLLITPSFLLGHTEGHRSRSIHS